MDSLIIIAGDYLIYAAFIYTVLHIYFLHEKKHHIRHVVTVACTAVFAWMVAQVVKNIVARPRPDLELALITPDTLYSFPSGHATFMFALAATMYAYDKRAGWILVAIAVVSGAARVLGGVHYWYDIAGGAILGCTVSLVVVALLKRLIRNY